VLTIAHSGWHGGGVAPRPRSLTPASPTPRPPSALSDAGADAQPPGSAGEHLLQRVYGSQERANRFYADQVRDRLLPAMAEFVQRMETLFVATADRHGECDSSLRAGPPGFVRVLDERTLAYPEYRGNGVHASLGNIAENAHVGILMVDFVEDLIGLHVNGTARIVEDGDFRRAHPGMPVDDEHGRRPERWVVVEVDEAYIHCRKHIPRMAKVAERREWGTDDPGRKGGDYFAARGTPARTARSAARRRLPNATHLTGGVSRVLRPRP
jgi:predicted pyridoxine 5'-phosphate oxidase superfamily flavin-nucleotide-binding protein